jgi:hypothetical protein
VAAVAQQGGALGYSSAASLQADTFLQRLATRNLRVSLLLLRARRRLAFACCYSAPGLPATVLFGQLCVSTGMPFVLAFQNMHMWQCMMSVPQCACGQSNNLLAVFLHACTDNRLGAGCGRALSQLPADLLEMIAGRVRLDAVARAALRKIEREQPGTSTRREHN